MFYPFHPYLHYRNSLYLILSPLFIPIMDIKKWTPLNEMPIRFISFLCF